MNIERFGANIVSVAGRELLITVTSGGSAAHLSEEAGTDQEPRAALFDHHRVPRAYGPSLAAYDLDQLAMPRWRATTLCGKPWVGMAPGEGGPIYYANDSLAFAPNCKRCLSLMDKHFPPPPTAPCLPLVVEMVTGFLCERGTAEIVGVPGDQLHELRKQVRSLLRQRTGHGSRTWVAGNRVIFSCDAIWEQHKAEHEREAREILDRLAARLETGEDAPLPAEPEWRLHWDTWATA